MTNEQGWKETLEDLDLRRERSRAMGGPERLAKHHGKGKLDARARLEHLLDKGSFREFGTLVGGEIAADGIVAGSGLIDGSPVMVGADDFTRWRAASVPAATPSATGWRSWRFVTGSRW
jgi:acetyl-CoA carboxylase carboxyltransferase component